MPWIPWTNGPNKVKLPGQNQLLEIEIAADKIGISNFASLCLGRGPKLGEFNARVPNGPERHINGVIYHDDKQNWFFRSTAFAFPLPLQS